MTRLHRFAFDSASQRLLGAALVLTVGLAVTGCVTTVEGGGQRPASQEQRVQAQLALARGYIEEGDWLSARGPLERALEIDARSSDAHVLLALVHQADGAYSNAEDHYRRALRFDRSSAFAMNNYGTFLYLQERYGEARRMLTRAVEDSAYPARARAYENLALTELALDDLDGAEQALRRALRLNPDLPLAHLELAEIRFKRGDNAAAIEHLETHRQLAPQTPRSLWLAIRLYGAVNDRDSVASYTLQLRNLFPDSQEYRLYQDRFE
jgi:type IV pilus assembly protein PilF